MPLMKIFAFSTLLVSVGFLAFVSIAFLEPRAFNLDAAAPAILAYILITMVYAVVTILFMRKSRRWRRANL